MPPIPFRWTGEVMVPPTRFQDKAKKRFNKGSFYTLDVVQDRSPESHRHFFACVREAWANLPEDLGADFPSADHLRKWALIKTGHCDKRSISCASKAEATRIAAFIRPMNDYAIVTVDGPVVTVFEAHSQRERAMGKKRFEQSKSDVFRVIGEMIGIDPAELGKAA